MARRRNVLVLVLAIAIAAATAPLALAAEPQLPDHPQVAATVEAAAALAAASGEPVMVASSLTRTSADYVNPDGTHTSDLAAGPVREPDSMSSSGWSPIDATLIAGSGIVTPRRVDASVVFTDGGLDGYLAKLTTGGDQVALDWLTSLSAPTLSGDTATYKDVYPGIDLELKALLDGFEQSFVVRAKPTAPLVFRIPLGLKGLSARMAADGSVELVDVATGAVKADSDPAVMMDSSRDPISDDPVTVAVATHVVQTVSGPVIEVTPDMAFFDRPGLVYPVIVDPATSVSTTHDTFVQILAPYNGTNQASPDLKVGSYVSDGSDIARSLISFWGPATATSLALANTTQVPAPAWAADPRTVVLDAQLHMLEYWSSSCAARQVRVSAPNTVWYQGAATWTNRPGGGANVYAQVTASVGNPACSSAITNCTTSGHTTIPKIFIVGGSGLPAGGSTIHLHQTDPCNDASGLALADLIQTWVTSPTTNFGIYLTAPNETTDSATWKRFNSTRSTTGGLPHMSVTYVSVPGVPGVWSPSSGSITATPAFTAKYNDTLTGSGTGALRFNVYPNATCTGTPTPYATAFTLANGATSTLTSPPALADGAYSYTVQGLAQWTDRMGVLHTFPPAPSPGLAGPATGCVWFTVDSTAPGPVTISSSSHPGSGVSSSTSFLGTWVAPPDASGIAGYAVTIDGTPGSDPGSTITQSGASISYSLTSAGPWFLHVRAVDRAGNAGSTSVYRFGRGIDIGAVTSTLTWTVSTDVGLLALNAPRAGMTGSVELTGTGGVPASATVSVFGPDGSLALATTMTDGASSLDDLPLPLPGVYIVQLTDLSDLGPGTVGASAFVIDPTTDITTTIDAAPVPVPLTTAGAARTVLFTVLAESRFGITIAAGAPHGEARLVAADGSFVGSVALGLDAANMGPVDAPSAGVYRLELDPEAGATGNATVSISTAPADVALPITLGVAAPLPALVPGQTAMLTGTANAGSAILIQASDSLISSLSATINASNLAGDEFANANYDGTGITISPVTIPGMSGAFEIDVLAGTPIPPGTYITVSEVAPDAVQALTLGTPVEVPLTAGQTARFDFIAPPSGLIRVAVAGSALPAGLSVSDATSHSVTWIHVDTVGIALDGVPVQPGAAYSIEYAAIATTVGTASIAVSDAASPTATLSTTAVAANVSAPTGGSVAFTAQTGIPVAALTLAPSAPVQLVSASGSQTTLAANGSGIVTVPSTAVVAGQTYQLRSATSLGATQAAPASALRAFSAVTGPSATASVLTGPDVVAAPSSSDSTIVVTSDNGVLSVPTVAGAPLVVDVGDGSPVLIGTSAIAGAGVVPAARISPSTALLPTSSTGVTTATQAVVDPADASTGGVRILSMLPAPQLTVQLPITLPTGAFVQVDADGAALVTNADAVVLATVDTIWCRDAANTPVPVVTTTVGSTVTVTPQPLVTTAYPLVVSATAYAGTHVQALSSPPGPALSVADQNTLIGKYAPILVEQRDELWAPTAMDTFLAHSRLMHGENGPDHLTPVLNPPSPLTVANLPIDSSTNFVLALNACQIPQLRGNSHWKNCVVHAAYGARLTDAGGHAIYARYVRTGNLSFAKTAVQYWIPYWADNFDSKSAWNRVTQQHQGDWEMVEVIWRDTANPMTDAPLSAAISAHACGYTRTWSDVAAYRAALPTHMIVHVGVGTHANYFSSQRGSSPNGNGSQRLDCDSVTSKTGWAGIWDAVPKFNPSKGDVLIAPSAVVATLRGVGLPHPLWTGTIEPYTTATDALRLDSGAATIRDKLSSSRVARFLGYWGQREQMCHWALVASRHDCYHLANVGFGPEGLWNRGIYLNPSWPYLFLPNSPSPWWIAYPKGA
jgi:hypothetical protein